MLHVSAPASSEDFGEVGPKCSGRAVLGGLGARGELGVGFPPSDPPAQPRTPGDIPSSLHLTLLSFLSLVAPAGAKAF